MTGRVSKIIGFSQSGDKLPDCFFNMPIRRTILFPAHIIAGLSFPAASGSQAGPGYAGGQDFPMDVVSLLL